MPASKRAYRGRIVQMDAAFTVIADGIIWTDGNEIAAVTPAGAPVPLGFEHLAPLNVGGTIYPGLIELHNHLSYDALPLWQVPKAFTNRDQWNGIAEYRRLISGPMSVLAVTPGMGPAICRYVEAKCLLAGVTTSQGITLNKAHFERYYRGVVRNVEEPLDPKLHRARAKISDVEAEHVTEFFKALNKASCQLLHLSEGIDAKARRHFLNLQMPDGNWAIAASLAGIHSAALKREDFDRLAGVGASMVWSPLSNLMLYGKTADVAAAKAAGMRFGLGSDWSPSGSKNLLHELRIARLASVAAGGVFADREIVAMATSWPAAILTWQNHLGSLGPGKLADFIVVRGKQGDPYAHVIDASETAISLVVIDGVPRLAIPSLSVGVPADAESVKVGGKKRLLNLHDGASDVIVEGLTLSVAAEQLSDALHRLPELASAPVQAALAHAAAAPTWTLVLEHEEPPGISLRPRFTASGRPGPTLRGLSDIGAAVLPPLSAVLKPIDIDPLTVADDADYVAGLKSQINIPQAIKDAIE